MLDAVQAVATKALPLQVSSVPLPLLARNTTCPLFAEPQAGSVLTVKTAGTTSRAAGELDLPHAAVNTRDSPRNGTMRGRQVVIVILRVEFGRERNTPDIRALALGRGECTNATRIAVKHFRRNWDIFLPPPVRKSRPSDRTSLQRRRSDHRGNMRSTRPGDGAPS